MSDNQEQTTYQDVDCNPVFCIHRKDGGIWNGYIECAIKSPGGVVSDSICDNCTKKEISY